MTAWGVFFAFIGIIAVGFAYSYGWYKIGEASGRRLERSENKTQRYKEQDAAVAQADRSYDKGKKDGIFYASAVLADLGKKP